MNPQNTKKMTRAQIRECIHKADEAEDAGNEGLAGYYYRLAAMLSDELREQEGTHPRL